MMISNTVTNSITTSMRQVRPSVAPPPLPPPTRKPRSYERERNPLPPSTSSDLHLSSTDRPLSTPSSSSTHAEGKYARPLMNATQKKCPPPKEGQSHMALSAPTSGALISLSCSCFERYLLFRWRPQDALQHTRGPPPHKL